MDQMIVLACVKGNMNGEGFVYIAGELWRATVVSHCRTAKPFASSPTTA